MSFFDVAAGDDSVWQRGVDVIPAAWCSIKMFLLFCQMLRYALMNSAATCGTRVVIIVIVHSILGILIKLIF